MLLMEMSGFEEEARRRAKNHGDMAVNAIDIVELYDRIHELEKHAKAPECLCGSMLQDPALRCPLHPGVRVRTFNERMDFEQAFDTRVQEGKKNR